MQKADNVVRAWQRIIEKKMEYEELAKDKQYS